MIRRSEQAETLKLHPKIVPLAKKLEFVTVPDLTTGGAFDVALQDVEAVLHIASPLDKEVRQLTSNNSKICSWDYQSDDYDRDIISPAVNMCTSLLASALNFPSIKRVVITSSMVTLIPFSWLSNPNTHAIYTAADINTDPKRSVSSSVEAYWSSKALARSAVHSFIKAHSPHFQTIQILPSVVTGPDDRAFSVQDLRAKTPLWELKLSPILGIKQAYPLVGVPIDVADVARAHVDALQDFVPGNRDYIMATGYPEGVIWEDMVEVAERKFGDRCGGPSLPLGGTLPTTKFRVDCEETESVFGWKFRSFEDSVERAIGQYLDFLRDHK